MLPAGESISKTVMEAMNTNVAGAAQTADAFVPLLSKADNPRVIFMSSGLGSLERHSNVSFNNKWPAYSATKAALNMIMLWYWKRFPEWKINACCPGFRVSRACMLSDYRGSTNTAQATALNNYGKVESHAPGKLEDGAILPVRLTLLDKDGESGTNTQRDDATGEISAVPW